MSYIASTFARAPLPNMKAPKAVLMQAYFESKCITGAPFGVLKFSGTEGKTHLGDSSFDVLISLKAPFRRGSYISRLNTNFEGKLLHQLCAFGSSRPSPRCVLSAAVLLFSLMIRGQRPPWRLTYLVNGWQSSSYAKATGTSRGVRGMKSVGVWSSIP
jgi:hypothetical protein